MDLKKFNQNIESQNIEEGLIDLAKTAWSKVKDVVDKMLIKKAAYAFFKKYPQLLTAVKAQFGQEQMTTESMELLEASGFKKGLMTVAITLALLSGIVGTASASSKLNTSSTSGFSKSSNTMYVTELGDLKNAKAGEMKKLIGSIIMDGSGNYIEVRADNQDDVSQFLGDRPASDFFVMSNSNFEGTGQAQLGSMRMASSFNQQNKMN